MNESSTRRRVLHFIDTTGPGGGETVFLQLAAGLRERGWVPTTVLVGRGWVHDQVQRLQLPVQIVPTSRRFDIAYIRRLMEIVRSHHIDLIHAHFFSPAMYASAVSMMTGVPVVATMHGIFDATSGGAFRTLRYGLLRRRSHIVSVSRSLREEMLKQPALRGARIDVVYNGTEITSGGREDGAAVRAALGVPDDTLLVGAIGNVRPAKDYGTLIRAAAELARDTQVVFVVAGERTDPLYTSLCSLRDSVGLDERRFRFLGFRDDVPALMSGMDVLAISSSTEGFSLAAIQAMAAGTPVVATRSGGPEEIITDGVDGLLVPASDPAALAAAIRRVAVDGALRRTLSSAGRRTVEERFSLAAMLDGYDTIYDALVPLRPAPRRRS